MKLKMLFGLFIVGILLLSFKNSYQEDYIILKQFNYPVLKGKENNPVLRICYENSFEKKTVENIKINLLDTKLSDLATVRVYFTGKDSIFKTRKKVLYGKPRIQFNDLLFKDKIPLSHGKNYFWVSYQLSDHCNLNSKIDADLDFITIDQNKEYPKKISPKGSLRTGLALQKHRDNNVHTYRIPGLTTTNKGTLLAVYDVRRELGRDLQGNIDIGLSRSTDKGESWEPMQIVLDMKTWGGLHEKFNGVSDASILVDQNTNTIYVAGLWMHGVINSKGKWIEGLNEKSRDWNHQWRNKGSQPGLDVKQTSQFLIVKSTDDGKTWSEPINLTKMCKDPKWWLWAPAPGHGITLNNGILVFPTQGRDENGNPFSNITYSKDGGITWHTSNFASQNTTESMVVELSNGSIMMNIRDNRNRKEKGDQNGRAIFTTENLGKIWQEHTTSHGALIEPVCMASIHKHTFKDKKGNQKSILLYSNPNDKKDRIKQTIKVSFDEGNSWPEKYWMELDEGKGAGYSCLTSIDDNTIGILYEGSQAQLTFQKIRLKELIDK